MFRVEFNNKEREMLESLVVGQTVKNVVLPTALAVGVGSAAYISYKALNAAYDWGQDIVDDMKDLVDKEKLEPILGKKTYSDPETGQTYNNPFAGIPVIGSLFGSGINIGIATNPFKE
ncbi:hypothetical protein N9Y01_01945 [Candidatus Poseidonia alphae]|nr:hypothetical protein [Candidatus Poseidonia alphae]